MTPPPAQQPSVWVVPDILVHAALLAVLAVFALALLIGLRIAWSPAVRRRLVEAWWRHR